MKRRKGWSEIELICKQCGEAFKTWEWRKDQKYCGRVCWSQSRIIPIEDRLDFIVDEFGCHVWQRAINKEGYAVLSIMNRVQRVHRALYEKKKGKIPEGLVIDHQCQNRACINLKHLEAVTEQVNSVRGNRWLRDENGRLLKGARKQPKNFMGRHA